MTHSSSLLSWDTLPKEMSKDEGLSRWVPVVASIGLFLVTTALAQIVKGKRKNSYDDDDDDVMDDDEVDIEELRRWYHSRRVHDRLSYENVQDSLINHANNNTHNNPNDSNENTWRRGTNPRAAPNSSLNELFDPPQSLRKNELEGNGNEIISEWDAHQRSRTKQAHEYLGSSREGSLQEMHPNADYDFHPKNRNWRHFEHFNEQDLPRHPYQSPGTVSQESPLPLFPQESSSRTSVHARMEDTDEEDDNTANSISSDGSESSEEQFVWMKHSHRSKSPLIKENSDEEQQQPWPGALRKRVPSFLNLFLHSTSEDRADVDEMSNSSNAATELSPRKVVDHSSSNQNQKLATPSRPPGPRRTMTCLDSDYRTTTTDDQKPAIKAVRRKSLPPTTTSTDETKSSFPLSLPKRWLGRGSGTSSSSTEQQPTKRVLRQSSSMTVPTSHNHRQLRAQYNATIMPEKVILIRHGQSLGNINELLYSTTPDNAMPLTPLGWEQARAAGEILKNKMLTSGESVHFIVSPYVRTVETFHGMASAWCDPKEFSHITNKDKRIKAWYRRLIEMGLTWNEDSRIREQDFGNYQDPETIRKAKKERHRFGVFYYRFPHGESASDVFDRVSTFLDSLWRSFEMNKSRNYVLVTHGISIRVFLARYFRYTIDQFNILANPRNCEMIILGHNGQGRLELQGRCALEVGPVTKQDTNNDDPQKEKEPEVHVTGYKFHKRLRILPKHAIRKVKIRISPDD